MKKGPSSMQEKSIAYLVFKPKNFWILFRHSYHWVTWAHVIMVARNCVLISVFITVDLNIIPTSPSTSRILYTASIKTLATPLFFASVFKPINAQDSVCIIQVIYIWNSLQTILNVYTCMMIPCIIGKTYENSSAFWWKT